MKRFFTIVIIGTLFIAFALWSGAIDIDWRSILQQIQRQAEDRVVTGPEGEKIRIVSEESVVIDVVEKVSPSVVTVGIVQDRPVFEYDPFDPFGFFQAPRQRSTQREEADIGSGFIVSGEGLIVTNRHVVDNADASYKIITSDNTSYEVENVYRDPANDIAIIKINPSAGSGQALKPVEMGDSDSIKVGQLVIALGTPLGEFRGSATKGIVSGIGRGITAGSPFEGVAEQLDNVIKTDAAINPGNSGGPLVNSSGQVIGVNTAVASGAENISFALPINLVKDALDNFRKTGSFDRAFLGVSYRMVTRQLSIMNNIPEGAFVLELVEGSSADDAGIQREDIITHFDAQRIQGDDGLAQLINKKKIGDRVVVRIWRDRKEKELTVQLGEYTQ